MCRERSIRHLLVSLIARLDLIVGSSAVLPYDYMPLERPGAPLLFSLAIASEVDRAASEIISLVGGSHSDYKNVWTNFPVLY